jgi:hypothetical protein
MMTLRNMRENGACSLAITCGAIWCNHEAVLDVNVFLEDRDYTVADIKALADRFEDLAADLYTLRREIERP